MLRGQLGQPVPGEDGIVVFGAQLFFGRNGNPGNCLVESGDVPGPQGLQPDSRLRGRCCGHKG